MEFVEREWSKSESVDYAERVRSRMIELRAVEATPVHITLQGIECLVGWVLRKKVLL